MPDMYQGLGMFDLNVECLSAKVYFMRRHWNMSKAMGKMLRQAYEVFQIDVGLGGNIFTWNFSSLSHLSQHNWFFDV